MTTAELMAKLEASKAAKESAKAALDAFQATSRARMEALTADAIKSVAAASVGNVGLRADLVAAKGRLSSVKARTRAIERGLAAEDRRNG